MNLHFKAGISILLAVATMATQAESQVTGNTLYIGPDSAPAGGVALGDPSVAQGDHRTTIEGIVLIEGRQGALFFGSEQTRGNSAEFGIEYWDETESLNFFNPAGSTAGFKNNVFGITKPGNVYIGVNPIGLDASYKLSVNGKIRAKEIVVETNWPDYVFESGYDLLSYPEIEEHIEKFGHLPGVPSAETVINNGMSMGATSRILLEKIEELTLLNIEMDKKVRSLNARLESFENNQEQQREIP